MTTTIEVTTADGQTSGPVPIDALEQAADGLFDGRAYQAPVPTLDGNRADKLKLTFAGGVEIDLMIEDDLEWFKALRFGQELDLRITATVAKVNWAYKRNAEDEETVTHQLGLAVHSYEIT